MRESVADTAGRSAAPLVVSLLVVSLATERWTYGLLASGVRRAIYGGTRTELGTAEIEADTNASGRVSRETVWILWTVITMTNGDVSAVHAPADTHWSGRRGRGLQFPPCRFAKHPGLIRMNTGHNLGGCTLLEFVGLVQKQHPLRVHRRRTWDGTPQRLHWGRSTSPWTTRSARGYFGRPAAGVEFHIRSRMEAKATL